LQYGPNSYAYTANGELATKTVGSNLTTYTYDELGNLTRVVLPGGAQIDYLIDGQHRRIGKKVGGTLTQGFLYDGSLRIVAELNNAGSLVSRFVFATRANVPDYMVKSGVTYRIITDHLGSPRLIVDVATGAWGIAPKVSLAGHCEERSDEAISQSFRTTTVRLPRSRWSLLRNWPSFCHLRVSDRWMGHSQ
jgi:YD repeat-containing protein